MHRIPSEYLVPCTGGARLRGLSGCRCFSGDLLCLGSWVRLLSPQAWQLLGAGRSLWGDGVKSPSRPRGLVAGQVKGPLPRLRLMSSREAIWLWGPPEPGCLPARLWLLSCFVCYVGRAQGGPRGSRRRSSRCPPGAGDTDATPFLTRAPPVRGRLVSGSLPTSATSLLGGWGGYFVPLCLRFFLSKKGRRGIAC